MAKKRKGRSGRAEGKSIGKSAMAAGAGAGVFYVWDNFLKDQKTLNEHWYARALATAVGGHMLKRKSLRYRRLGEGILGAAGFMLARDYKAQQDAKKQPQNAAGWMDAGALVGSPVQSPFDTGAPEETVYLNLPDVSGYEEDEDLAEAGEAGSVDVGALVGSALDLNM